MSKPLYIIITDSGDGSQGLSYTFDSALVYEMDRRQDELDDYYQSGDGLQVSFLTVPTESTYESLGISQYSVQENPFETQDEE